MTRTSRELARELIEQARKEQAEKPSEPMVWKDGEGTEVQFPGVMRKILELVAKEHPEASREFHELIEAREKPR